MNRATLKKLYREALVQVFGTGNKLQDKYLLDAVKRDIHLADQAPGQWSPDSVLEIYCEGGIPNATDIFDPSWRGFAGKAVYNADKWAEVDDIVNLMLSVSHPGTKVYHEPYNNAVVNIGYCFN
jgi:hypothetical protein